MAKPKRAVGIDIGTRFIKIAILNYIEDDIKLENYIIEKIPEKVIENGIVKLPEELSEIVSGLLQEKGINPKNASIGVSLGEETASIKWVNLPDLSDKEMKQAIQSIVEDELLHPPDKLYYNWGKQSPDEKNEDESITIILVGVIKEVMDSHIKFLRGLKIKPYFAEVDIFSTLRSLLGPNTLGNESVNKLVVDIGYNETIMGFIQDGKFTYMRNIPIGSKNYIEAIAEAREVERKEAEKELILNGAIADDIFTIELEKQSTAEVIKGSVEELIEQIQETIYFYEDRTNGEVDEIILSGGGSRLDGIEEFFKEKLSIPCRMGLPYFYKPKEEELPEEEEEESVSENNFFEDTEAKREKTPLEKDLSSLNIAIGLALKEVHDNV